MGYSVPFHPTPHGTSFSYPSSKPTLLGQEIEIVGNDQSDHRMRCDSDIVSREATVEPQRALLPHHLPKAVKHALVRQLAIRALGLLLQTRLDEIKRKREERGEEAGNSTRRQGLRARPERRILQPGFGLREEGQLTEVERHGSHNRRIRTSPEAQHAFVPRNAGQRIPNTSIIRQLRRVTSHGGQSAGHQSCTSPLAKANLPTLIF